MKQAIVPTIGVILALLLFAATLARAGALLGADGDLFLHIAYGEAVLSSGGIPDHDPVVFTTLATDPFVLHEWASEVIFALLNRAFSLSGPVMVLAVVVAGLPLVAYRRSIAQDHGVWIALIAALLVYFGLASHQLARPHLASWLLAPALLWVLARWQRRGAGWLDTAVGVAGLGALWANLHGGGLALAAILLGIVCLGAVIQPQDRPRITVFWQGAVFIGALGLGSLVNPDGYVMHVHLAEFLSHTGDNVAADFGPPNLDTGTLWTAVVLLGALWPSLVVGWRSLSWTDRLLAVVISAMAVASMRNLPFLGLLVVPIAAKGAASFLRTSTAARALWESGQRLAGEERGRSGWALLVGTAIVGAVALAILPPAPSGPNVPTEASAWLANTKRLAEKRGYAGYDASGYLLHLNQLDSVYLHALNANTPWRLMDEHKTLETAAPGWPRLLDHHKVMWTLSAQDGPLVNALDEHRCWRRDHTDERWVAHVRRPARCRD